ncbi:hypothetical protein AB1N83_009726 [Pleurotus pulmonarius]
MLLETHGSGGRLCGFYAAGWRLKAWESKKGTREYAGNSFDPKSSSIHVQLRRRRTGDVVIMNRPTGTWHGTWQSRMYSRAMPMRTHDDLHLPHSSSLLQTPRSGMFEARIVRVIKQLRT